MNIQTAFWLIGGALFLGFCIGRFVFFMKNGQLITSLVKQRTVYMRNMKPGTVYKAMAAQFKRDGFVVITNPRDIEKAIKQLANALNVVPESLTYEDRGQGNYKISKKISNE